MNSATIEELADNDLTFGTETELVFFGELVFKEEIYEEDDCINYRNRYVNPLYRHCDLGGE